MKNRILKIASIVFFITIILLGLTACGKDKSKEEVIVKQPDLAKKMIQSAIIAVDSQDANKLCELIDFEALENVLSQRIDQTEFQKGLQDFLTEHDDLLIEAKRIQKITDDTESIQELLAYYDSYKEYKEEMEEKYQIENLEVYLVELDVPGKYAEAFDISSIIQGKDIVYVTKQDDEYKMIYSSFALELFDEEMYEEEAQEKSLELEQEVIEFNSHFEGYDGKQTGDKVKELLEHVNAYQIENHDIDVSYYKEDGWADEVDISEENEINLLKDKINETHEYLVEYENDEDGYLCFIDILY